MLCVPDLAPLGLAVPIAGALAGLVVAVPQRRVGALGVAVIAIFPVDGEVGGFHVGDGHPQAGKRRMIRPAAGLPFRVAAVAGVNGERGGALLGDGQQAVAHLGIEAVAARLGAVVLGHVRMGGVDVDDVAPGYGVVVHHGQQLGDGVGIQAGGIGLGAVEAVLLSPEEGEAHRVGQGLILERLGDRQQGRDTGAVVGGTFGALLLACAVVVGTDEDHLVTLALELGDQVLGVLLGAASGVGEGLVLHLVAPAGQMVLDPGGGAGLGLGARGSGTYSLGTRAQLHQVFIGLGGRGGGLGVIVRGVAPGQQGRDGEGQKGFFHTAILCCVWFYFSASGCT